jgi:hypothetical protein
LAGVTAGAALTATFGGSSSSAKSSRILEREVENPEGKLVAALLLVARAEAEGAARPNRDEGAEPLGLRKSDERAVDETEDFSSESGRSSGVAVVEGDAFKVTAAVTRGELLGGGGSGVSSGPVLATVLGRLFCGVTARCCCESTYALSLADRLPDALPLGAGVAMLCALLASLAALGGGCAGGAARRVDFMSASLRVHDSVTGGLHSN